MYLEYVSKHSRTPGSEVMECNVRRCQVMASGPSIGHAFHPVQEVLGELLTLQFVNFSHVYTVGFLV